MPLPLLRGSPELWTGLAPKVCVQWNTAPSRHHGSGGSIHPLSPVPAVLAPAAKHLGLGRGELLERGRSSFY